VTTPRNWVLVEILDARAQASQKASVLALRRLVNGDQAPSRVRELGTATLAATRLALDQGAFRQVVHGIHGVPGMLVGHAHGLSRLGDGAGLADEPQQFDPPPADEGLVIQVQPQIGRRIETGAGRSEHRRRRPSSDWTYDISYLI